MRIDGKDISTPELEKMFYAGTDQLEKVREALSEEMAKVEKADATLIHTIVDNIEHAAELLNETSGLYGVLVRAQEMADAALDYYENFYLEEVRQIAEKDMTAAPKLDAEGKAVKYTKPTDAVMKAQAAVKVAVYRRFRNYVRGYVSGCEKRLTSMRTIVEKCQAQAYLAQRQTYRAPEQQ